MPADTLETEDVEAKEAFDGARATYDFFRNVLLRNSIDNKGAQLDSSVHYGVKFDNALWNGRQMIYGDGDGELFNRFTVALARRPSSALRSRSLLASQLFRDP